MESDPIIMPRYHGVDDPPVGCRNSGLYLAPTERNMLSPRLLD